MTFEQPQWTPAREQRLREFWPKKAVPLRVIAAEMQVSTSALSQAAKRMGLPSRYAVRRNAKDTHGVMSACRFTEKEHAYLANCANVRNLPMRKLIQAILLAVAADKMVDAILDDGIKEGPDPCVRPTPPNLADCTTVIVSAPSLARRP